MSKFENQLARMQGLMNYGMVSESKDQPSKAIEHQALAADGKSYAIIKENAKYFIKSASADQANIVESYQYIDGWNQRNKHSYNSYAEASKNFEMKMSSLKEAYRTDIRKENLNEFVNEAYMDVQTDDMLNEIARQRQIMHNAAIIMNEASEISMNNTSDPERVSGNSGDTDAPFTDKAEATLDKDPKQASGKPESMSDPYGDKTKTPKDKVVDKVNEENENEEELLNDEEGDEEFELIGDDSEDDIENDSDEDLELEPEEGEEDFSDDEEFEEGGDEEFSEEGDEDFEEEGKEDTIESLRSEIEELQSRLDALEGEESEDFEDDEDFEEEGDEDFEDDEDLGDEDNEEFGDEGDEDLGDDEDFEEEGDEEFEDEDDEDESVDLSDEMAESIVRKVSNSIIQEQKKQYYMNSIIEEVVGSIISEGRNSKPVVKEEGTRLHAFGKHPGYRKKPMQLPETGSDEFQGNKDWNDESVHNEQPFGQGKGDSKPYEKIIDDLTESIIKELKKKA